MIKSIPIYLNRTESSFIRFKEYDNGKRIMKKKYFSIIFLIFVVAAITLTSDPSVKVMKRMFFTGAIETEKKEITIVIDPGHPRT